MICIAHIDGFFKKVNPAFVSSILGYTKEEILWIADKEGNLVEVNDAYCRMSEYTEQELLSMNINDLGSYRNGCRYIHAYTKSHF